MLAIGFCVVPLTRAIDNCSQSNFDRERGAAAVRRVSLRRSESEYRFERNIRKANIYEIELYTIPGPGKEL